MQLTERTAIDPVGLPVAELRAFLRLGTGFGDDTLQDATLISALRAAIGMIERQIATSLILRDFILELRRWNGLNEQPLPRGPVTAVSEIVIRGRDGERTIFDRERYSLTGEGFTSILTATRGLPRIPPGSVAEVSFAAGYGSRWEDVPADLALAALTLAAARYEDRDGTIGFPEAVSSLIAPYRPLRLLRSI